MENLSHLLVPVEQQRRSDSHSRDGRASTGICTRGEGFVIWGGLTPFLSRECHPKGCRDPRPPHHSVHVAPAPSPKSPLQSPNWDSKSPHSQHPVGWEVRMRGVRREARSRDPRGNTARGSAPHRLPRMVGSSSCSGRFPVRTGLTRLLSTNSWE